VSVNQFWVGLEERLFERLASSPAEPNLRAVKELFVNFWGLYIRYKTVPITNKTLPAAEAQTFSLQAPEFFFGLYSPPRSDSVFKAARARLEEELRFSSKIVSLHVLAVMHVYILLRLQTCA
jgi:syntaxin-binding protein 1